MIYFSKKYLFYTLLLLTIEVLIALFVHDNFIRPFGGDVLVVILIYCFFKTFIKASPVKVALPVLLFAYLVELLQSLNFVDHLGLGQSKFWSIIIGNSFSWLDFLAYTIGFLIILIFEKILNKQKVVL